MKNKIIIGVLSLFLVTSHCAYSYVYHCGGGGYYGGGGCYGGGYYGGWGNPGYGNQWGAYGNGNGATLYGVAAIAGAVAPVLATAVQTINVQQQPVQYAQPQVIYIKNR